TAVCSPVARTDAQYRLREIQLRCAMLPGAALNAPCPAYGFTAVCGPVARTDAPHRLRETLSLCARLPGAALNAPCPDYGF
ncbi:TPA: hypothetical protein ACU9TI_003794, partial [Klebsiella oxytoca]